MKKLLCLTLMAIAFSAQAQTSEFVQLVPTEYLPKNVNFSVGSAGVALPKYTGSDEHRYALYPIFDAQWKNGVFFSAISGLGYNFSKDTSSQYGLRISIESPRDVSRSTKLRGLGDVNSAIEPGAFYNFSLSPTYALTSSVRYGSGVDHNAFQLSLGGRATTLLSTYHRLTASVGANWANSNYLRSYFGVNAAQALASGYSQYTPNAGITDFRANASWNWTIDTNWSLTTGASVKHLTGDAANSPFVFQKNPVTVFSAATYRF